MGTHRGEIKEVLPWLVRLTCRAGTKVFCSALAAVGPVQHICFHTVHYLHPFVPIGQQAAQAALLGRLSLSVCLWYRQALAGVYDQGSSRR